MITALKAQSLMIFAQSRLAGLMSGKVARETTNNDSTEDTIKEIADTLAQSGHTVKHLNDMPNTYTAQQLTYYYELCLNTFNKNIKAGDEIIENIIGLNILSHLSSKRTVVKTDVDIDSILKEINQTASKEDRILIMKMKVIAGRIVKGLDGANYKKWQKMMVKQSKKTKRRVA